MQKWLLLINELIDSFLLLTTVLKIPSFILEFLKLILNVLLHFLYLLLKKTKEVVIDVLQGGLVENNNRFVKSLNDIPEKVFCLDFLISFVEQSHVHISDYIHV